MARVLSIWILLAGVLASVDAEEANDDKAVQGTWTPAMAELSGQPYPDAELKTFVLKMHEGKYEASVAGQPDRGTYALDTKSTPKAMTIKGTDGPNKGKTFLCIYELSGDSLRVCYDLSGKKTPTEFATAKGTPLYLVTYTRKKE
jgi:uncharacterized protein (TIGR03067 family)